MYALEEWNVRTRILSSHQAANSSQESFNASLQVCNNYKYELYSSRKPHIDLILHVNSDNNSLFQGVPDNCRMETLEKALLECDVFWEDQMRQAAAANHTLWQHRKQSPKRVAQEERRRVALANGAMGQSIKEHLFALSSYIKLA